VLDFLQPCRVVSSSLQVFHEELSVVLCFTYSTSDELKLGQFFSQNKNNVKNI
ncbi:hypothetical protein X975_02075, partial [Stegodyphus mimosarum]